MPQGGMAAISIYIFHPSRDLGHIFGHKPAVQWNEGPEFPDIISLRYSNSIYFRLYCSMPFRIGQTVRGGKASYKLLHPLKGTSVFKASVVVPNQNQQSDAKLYAIYSPEFDSC
jgi:hypothetical protein